jgi:5-formyltetrahydrofolate cyclo-ligase
VALAFRAQLVESVPTAPCDRDVDIIVTADREILCSERARQRAGL